MKKQLFSTALFAFAMLLGMTAFGQRTSEADVTESAPAEDNETAFTTDRYIVKTESGMYENSYIRFKTLAAGKSQQIGEGQIGCHGSLNLPAGVSHIAKTEVLYFKCDDGSNEFKILIEGFEDDRILIAFESEKALLLKN